MSTIANRLNVTEALSIVAENLGISSAKARCMYYDPSAYKEKGENPVAKAMSDMGFIVAKNKRRTPEKTDVIRQRMLAIPEGVKAKNYKDVAQILGIPYQTVRNAMSTSVHNRYSTDLCSIVHDACEKLDVVSPRSPEGKVKAKERYLHMLRSRYYQGGNFHTEAEEIQRMQKLREEGYTNIEISRKVGRSYTTVLKKLGYQPKDMTENSMAKSGEARARKNQERKVYTANHTILAYNDTVHEIRSLRDEAKVLLDKAEYLEKKLEESVHSVKAAQKIGTLAVEDVRMHQEMQDLASVSPTLPQ